ncbi:MAG: hypothetical protein PHS46_02790 [Candidatus Omnitrophica bacterium]|nr:hypothetical protein [Candidatus Omnitrophota bacterium]
MKDLKVLALGFVVSCFMSAPISAFGADTAKQETATASVTAEPVTGKIVAAGVASGSGKTAAGATTGIAATSDATAPVTAEAPQKELTKAEKLDRVNESLNNFAEIMNFIPDLKKEVDSNGKASYTFQGKKLENLDDETLGKLFGRVRNEASRIRTERVNKQLNFIRKMEQFNRQRRAIATTSAKTNYNIPKATATISTPKIPKIPKIPKTTSYK